MPIKPKSPCRYPGCPKLTASRYCEEHKKNVDAQYNKFQRDPDSVRLYGSRWRKIRACFIKAHPLCELCKQKNTLTPAQEVHHIVSLRDGCTYAAQAEMSLFVRRIYLI